MVRTDAVVAAQEDLPALPEPDPGLVDEVAVQRACAGDRVRLNRPEVAVVAARLRSRGLTCAEIDRRLRRDLPDGRPSPARAGRGGMTLRIPPSVVRALRSPTGLVPATGRPPATAADGVGVEGLSAAVAVGGVR